MPSLQSLLLVSLAGFASAGPLASRAVKSLNEDAFEEAQQRDDTATRAFSNVQIKTSDGKCLYVDKLSGDFRANLTPVQVGTCGATDGQGWDIITAGKHNDQKGTMLVVNTLTQACMNFDPRRAAGNQVNLFSCGGRADGGGRVTNSQLFTFTGGSGPLSLKPVNEVGSCFTVKGNAIDVAQCSSGDEKQDFAIGGGAGSGNDAADGKPASSSTDAATTTTAGDAATTLASQAPEATTADNAASSSSKCTQRTRTVTVTPSASTSAAVTIKAPVSTTDTSSSVTAIETGEALSPTETDPLSSDTTSGPPPTTTTSPSGSSGGTEGGSPTASIPVSRAGGVLNPSAAAESHRRDETATRAFASVEIRAPNGQCLSADPTAGDFRQNLIPVALVDCSGADGEKWDVITAGKHNNADGAVIVVSALTQGCISFDSRRPAGDTVTLFSCGGRADGGGETNAGQLIPFIGALSFPFAPMSENNGTCLLPGDAGRLDAGPCPAEVGPQLFSIFD